MADRGPQCSQHPHGAFSRADRAQAAAEALLGSPGWKKRLRERIGALSWDRIAGERTHRPRLGGSRQPLPGSLQPRRRD